MERGERGGGEGKGEGGRGVGEKVGGDKREERER